MTNREMVTELIQKIKELELETARSAGKELSEGNSYKGAYESGVSAGYANTCELLRTYLREL